MALAHRQPSVDTSRFAMVPRADIPRASFKMQNTHKTTFSASYLVPVYTEEVLPGDTINLKMTAFTRMATPLYPIMDNLYLESFFFFVPNRLLWANWKKFMGEQASPGDSISYVVPQTVSPAGGFARFSIYDYCGLPCTPNLGANTVSVNVLPFRAYRLIYNEWFRDQNLVTLLPASTGDGPDSYTSYELRKRAKQHDYFTSALPFAQKGAAVSLPLSGSATIRTSATELVTGAQTPMHMTTVSGGTPSSNIQLSTGSATIGSGKNVGYTTTGGGTFVAGLYPNNLYADLSSATATTINALRQSFQIQRLLERDARGGTRYTELLRAHFGVISPDARLQRPEYLGGGRSPIQIMPVLQQSATGLTGGTTPIGSLGGVAVAVHNVHGFSQSFTEHGIILGMVNVRADITYQQGIRRMWSRSTRYDYYWPAFAMLGEQAILNKELYCDGSANDLLVFGYQERWAEYRYHPSKITGAYNSTFSTPLDAWHLAQEFASLPTLNQTFIEDGTEATLRRALALGAAADNQQFIADFFFDITAARPLPMYSVPGMMDHF